MVPFVFMALARWASASVGNYDYQIGRVPMYVWVDEETQKSFQKMCADEGVTPHEIMERWLGCK